MLDAITLWVAVLGWCLTFGLVCVVCCFALFRFGWLVLELLYWWVGFVGVCW